MKYSSLSVFLIAIFSLLFCSPSLAENKDYPNGSIGDYQLGGYQNWHQVFPVYEPPEVYTPPKADFVEPPTQIDPSPEENRFNITPPKMEGPPGSILSPNFMDQFKRK